MDASSLHEEAEDASDVSREHQIYVREDGVVIIAGGKLTTYRIMAKEVVKATIGWLKDLDIDLFDDREVSSFAEVGDTFDDFAHHSTIRQRAMEPLKRSNLGAEALW